MSLNSSLHANPEESYKPLLGAMDPNLHRPPTDQNHHPTSDPTSTIGYLFTAFCSSSVSGIHASSIKLIDGTNRSANITPHMQNICDNDCCWLRSCNCQWCCSDIYQLALKVVAKSRRGRNSVYQQRCRP
ncbi:hypothetical protein E3N88_12752 [Mikania micrantha]|uniref:Uncharacterized protein n=1 Tax=Mikania micrantha TaxID=192012 RepID=A0A5N6P6U7_9ASTR|nr:hypothetical protein E3N88_12752 [Mikania micrantha]